VSRALTWFFIGGSILASTTLRADPIGRTASPRRQANAQLGVCMTKRMLSDRAITYYDAMKICQDQLNRRIAGLPSRNLSASISAATR